MADTDIRIKVGVSVDASTASILSPIEQAAKRARKAVESDLGAAAKGAEKATAKKLQDEAQDQIQRDGTGAIAEEMEEAAGGIFYGSVLDGHGREEEVLHERIDNCDDEGCEEEEAVEGKDVGEKECGIGVDLLR